MQGTRVIGARGRDARMKATRPGKAGCNLVLRNCRREAHMQKVRTCRTVHDSKDRKTKASNCNNRPRGPQEKAHVSWKKDAADEQNREREDKRIEAMPAISCNCINNKVWSRCERIASRPQRASSQLTSLEDRRKRKKGPARPSYIVLRLTSSAQAHLKAPWEM